MSELTLSEYYKAKSLKPEEHLLAEPTSHGDLAGTAMGVVASDLDVAIRRMGKAGRVFSESEYDNLLGKYLGQMNLAENYEKLIQETDEKVSSLLTKLALIFVAVVILTAFVFSVFF